ncbi:LysR family transcriptional regulator [Mesorhizobium sp. M7D.F.Ca.US.005.01.1.1]|uniref:LysR family transcriptional regulator n=1 Tax=Mesorhizobium sp. M7D.F.Ca.US.005.01.1.1 TaxID=2493678 RepID=UPI000F75F9BE|nr:LysR family transcriptional regulator [Mesorhizobium sp. M7D.F.Ca.US.005.01.1.1]AZO41603.1 LysR family transcriptional regulator [Mesorhizobium sp. M7D.F.Ca.US.005.01.1.1]
MNARHLEVFRAIMRHSSLTAAAEALHVSQPAVSKMLRHFESLIGYKLFERIGGRLVATPEAHLLFRDADRIFREIEVLEIYSNRIRDKQLSLLRIAASAPPTFALLPAATRRFRRRNPGARLVLQTLPAEEIAERILTGDIDLGLTMTTLPEPHIRNEVVGAADIIALILPESPLAVLKTITPTDLAQQTLISYGMNTPAGQMLARVFQEQGPIYDPQIEISLSIAAAPLVSAGLGVALVDGLVPWAQFGHLKVLPFQPRSALDIVLVTSTTLPQSRFGREFARDIQAAIHDVGRGK